MAISNGVARSVLLLKENGEYNLRGRREWRWYGQAGSAISHSFPWPGGELIKSKNGFCFVVWQWPSFNVAGSAAAYEILPRTS